MPFFWQIMVRIFLWSDIMKMDFEGRIGFLQKSIDFSWIHFSLNFNESHQRFPLPYWGNKTCLDSHNWWLQAFGSYLASWRFITESCSCNSGIHSLSKKWRNSPKRLADSSLFCRTWLRRGSGGHEGQRRFRGNPRGWIPSAGTGRRNRSIGMDFKAKLVWWQSWNDGEIMGRIQFSPGGCFKD